MHEDVTSQASSASAPLRWVATAPPHSGGGLWLQQELILVRRKRRVDTPEKPAGTAMGRRPQSIGEEFGGVSIRDDPELGTG